MSEAAGLVGAMYGEQMYKVSWQKACQEARVTFHLDRD